MFNLKNGHLPEICYTECASVVSWYNFTENQEQLCVKNTESDFKKTIPLIDKQVQSDQGTEPVSII